MAEQAPPPADTAVDDQAPLDDLMIAMDVVDTLRREQRDIERELNSDEQEERLIKRLREMYTAQGIEVSDQILTEGVEALRHDRFRYEPTPPSLERRLAEIYIDRWHWLSRLFILAALTGIVGAGYWVFVAGPRARLRREVPQQITRIEQAIEGESRDESATKQAKTLAEEGQQALAGENMSLARQKLAELQKLKARLDQEYELRIVAKGVTGVWKVPKANENARNYYIVVEPVTPEGTVLSLPVTSEEDGVTSVVSKWGLRVDEFTAQQVEQDKKDDGIIQNRLFGFKRKGSLEPEYRIPTTGGAITRW